MDFFILTKEMVKNFIIVYASALEWGFENDMDPINMICWKKGEVVPRCLNFLLTRGLMGEIEEGLLPNSISWGTYFLFQIVCVLKSS